MQEIWKPIKGYEGLYEVSSLGNVKSLRRNVFLKPGRKESGYLIVSLYKHNSGKNFYVHRLVAEAFIPNPDNLPIINHKDEVKTNNCVDNLEWCDYKYNNSFGTRIERMIDTKVKNGFCNPDMVGLDKKNYKKIYRENHKEEIKDYKRLYYQKHKSESK